MSRMKRIILFLLISTSAIAQKAVLDGDSIRYKDKVYYVDQVVQLGNGSKSDKGFAFVSVTSFLYGDGPLKADLSNYKVKLDKLVMKFGKPYLRGYLIDENELPVAKGNKIFINIEEALNSKEMY